MTDLQAQQRAERLFYAVFGLFSKEGAFDLEKSIAIITAELLAVQREKGEADAKIADNLAGWAPRTIAQAIRGEAP